MLFYAIEALFMNLFDNIKPDFKNYLSRVALVTLGKVYSELCHDDYIYGTEEYYKGIFRDSGHLTF